MKLKSRLLKKNSQNLINNINNTIMKKEDFAKEIKEIVELVKMCPQNLQEKCFEILLSHVLSQKEGHHTTPVAKGGTIDQSSGDTQGIHPEVKKRLNAFSGQHQLSETEIYKVFSVDETGNVNIEVTDLKSKKIAQQQRKLALLIGVKHQFTDGGFNVPKDELREACVTYSAYDAANFVQNLKNMKEIFAWFKPTATNKLSPLGKSQAASLIKELAS